VLPEIDGTSATRLELLIGAARAGDAAMAVGMLASIPAADLEAIHVRLALFGIDLRELIHDPKGIR
jgi:hypothetical protein